MALLAAGIAPPAHSQQAALPAILADRQHAVENSLLPHVPVEGLPGWNLRDRMRHHHVPGLSIAVIHNYQIDWVAGYGLADTIMRTPVTPQTLFSAGSISKFVTAGMALRLAQENRIDLDAPVNTYLKGWRLADNDFTKAAPVTLRLLLSHRAGTSQSAYFGFVPRPEPYPTVVDILSGRPGTGSNPVVVNRPVGAGFNYSGGGYLVAQQALIDATGLSFNELAYKTIFRPLRMSRATFAQPLPKAAARQAAWSYSGAAWYEGRPYVYPQQAAAGLYATPTDLARFIIEIQAANRGRGRVLSPASARTMLTPLADVSSGTYREQIGVGAFLLQLADRPANEEISRYFEHTGVNAGFVAYAIGSVVGGEGMVVMMNADGGAAELGKEIRRAVAKVYGWPDFLLPAVTPVAHPVAGLDSLAGRYAHGPDEVVIFERQGAYLIQRFSTLLGSGTPILCVPQRGDTLAFTDFPLRAVFVRAANGQISGYRMLVQETVFSRLSPQQLQPHELAMSNRLTEAATAYRAMQLSENHLTYNAYELINRQPSRPADLQTAEMLLQIAQERFPGSNVVFARWGDLYRVRGDMARARSAYQKALDLNPGDETIKKRLAAMP